MTRSRFSKDPETFRVHKGIKTITNLTTTELFYSHMLNMNRGSLHTRNFRRVGLLVFRYRSIKTRFTGAKTSKSFRVKQASAGWHRTRVALVEGERSHNWANPASLTVDYIGYFIFLYLRQAVEFF